MKTHYGNWNKYHQYRLLDRCCRHYCLIARHVRHCATHFVHTLHVSLCEASPSTGYTSIEYPTDQVTLNMFTYSDRFTTVYMLDNFLKNTVNCLTCIYYSKKTMPCQPGGSLCTFVCYMVPPLGIEPSSSVLQTGAMTTSAKAANFWGILPVSIRYYRFHRARCRPLH